MAIDDDTPKVQPALSEAEWAEAMDPDGHEGLVYELSYLWGRSRPGAVLAILNDALPKGHPAKITRGKLALLRQAISYAVDDDWAREPDFLPASAFLDALAAYLPPDTP